MELRPIKILGTGCYLPQPVLSETIESHHQLAHGWSEKYSGVKQRHHITFESNGYMGAKALENAIEKTGIHLSEIDLLISAGGTFDYPLPNQACIIKSELKNGNQTNFGTIDIDCTCLSFVTALDMASRYLDGKQFKNIAIVSTEIASKGINPNHKETLTLFGDAAVAVIVSYDNKFESGVIKGDIKTYSEGAEYTIIKGGGNKYFFKEHPYHPELHSFHMEGLKLLKMAKKKIPSFMDEFFKNIPFNINDSTWVLPHQASKTGLEIFFKLYPEIRNKSLSNLENRGNCIAASIPLLLHENIENGTIKRNDLLFLTGTSAGFSIGGCLLKY